MLLPAFTVDLLSIRSPKLQEIRATDGANEPTAKKQRRIFGSSFPIV
jgi:hypothetical protein